MTLPGAAMLITLASAVVVARRAIRERRSPGRPRRSEDATRGEKRHWPTRSRATGRPETPPKLALRSLAGPRCRLSSVGAPASGTERASRSSLVTTRVSPGRQAARASRKAGPLAVGAGDAVVDVDPVGLHAEGREGLALGGEVLAVSRDRGVADLHRGHGRSLAGCPPLTGHLRGRVVRERAEARGRASGRVCARCGTSHPKRTTAAADEASTAWRRRQPRVSDSRYLRVALDRAARR